MVASPGYGADTLNTVDYLLRLGVLAEYIAVLVTARGAMR
jgi:hypothetical protein